MMKQTRRNGRTPEELESSWELHLGIVMKGLSTLREDEIRYRGKDTPRVALIECMEANVCSMGALKNRLLGLTRRADPDPVDLSFEWDGSKVHKYRVVTVGARGTETIISELTNVLRVALDMVMVIRRDMKKTVRPEDVRLWVFDPIEEQWHSADAALTPGYASFLVTGEDDASQTGVHEYRIMLTFGHGWTSVIWSGKVTLEQAREHYGRRETDPWVKSVHGAISLQQYTLGSEEWADVDAPRDGD